MNNTAPTPIKVQRLKLGMNQSEFWGPVGVTQSGGSRFEHGRDIPEPVKILLEIAYGTEKKCAGIVNKLRSKD